MSFLTEKEEQQLKIVVRAKMAETEIKADMDQFERFWSGVLRNFDTLISIKIYELKAEHLNRTQEMIRSFENRSSPLSESRIREGLAIFLCGLVFGGILMAICTPH